MSEVRDAVSGRAVVFVVGVLAIQLAFIGSYLGAFHQPSPHRIPIAVVAPAGTPQAIVHKTVEGLNALPNEALDARAVANEQQARTLIDQRELVGALALSPPGQPDRLLTATAAGASTADALRGILGHVEQAQRHSMVVEDVKPIARGDARGMAGFYLVVGWIVGGYLVAAILGMTAGTRPANRIRATIRLCALLIYALLSGIGGAILVSSITGIGAEHFLELSAFGALLVFAVGAFTTGLQVLAKTAGIGIAIILFVVLGNPSSGGAIPREMLPAFWRELGPWLPTGAGTSGVRGIAYFDSVGLMQPCLVLAGYLVVGVAVSLIAARAITNDTN